MIATLLQQVAGTIVPTVRATFVDWAVVGGILVLILGFVVRVILPGWMAFKKSQEATVTVNPPNGNGNAVHEAEWRGRLGNQLDQQDKRLDALLSATTAMERVMVEIERRGRGTEGAIATVADMAPKLDAVLAIARNKSRRKRS